MCEHRVVSAYKGKDIRYDGYNYYIRVNGRNLVIDFKTKKKYT